MITSLHISNYALITQLDINFSSGLNIITGETGAGKSIILGALSLLLGARADMKVIKEPLRKSVIEASFNTSDIEGWGELANILDIDIDNGNVNECIVRRELLPSGRSRAFVNDTPVSLTTLQQATERLIDIHSQHENLMLTNFDFQLSILDIIAENKDLLDSYKEKYRAYRAVLKQFADTRDMIRKNKADSEYIAFQLEQLDEMNLQPGEQASLEQEREMLADMTNIKTSLSEALDALSSGTDSAVSLTAKAISALKDIESFVPELTLERLESVRIELDDIADTLAARDNKLSADPEMLISIEQRLSNIYSLANKHHVENSDQLITLRDKLRAQLSAINNSDETLATLEAQAREAKKAAMMVARELSQRRSKAAEALAVDICNEARPLGLHNLQCRIDIEQGKLNETGIDSVQFLFSFNKNQQPIQIGHGASGGEISRLAFAIKTIVAKKRCLPTMVFDEIDSGISGDIANRMGMMMHNMAKNIQTIVITHLPQVAAKADTHFMVYKIDDNETTNTHIRQLSQNERVDEVARMLSGDSIGDEARANARTLFIN